MGGLDRDRETCPYTDNASPFPLLGSFWTHTLKGTFGIFSFVSPKRLDPWALALGRGMRSWEASESGSELLRDP